MKHSAKLIRRIISMTLVLAMFAGLVFAAKPVYTGPDESQLYMPQPSQPLMPAPTSTKIDFTDVKNDRFAPAILWAAEQGITTGTGDGTTFSPEDTCTRGQIVTFLYRAMVG